MMLGWFVSAIVDAAADGPGLVDTVDYWGVEVRTAYRKLAIDDVDYSAAAKLRSIHGILKEKGIRLVFVMISDDVRAELDRFGITDLVGEDAFYATGKALLDAYHERKD